MRSLIITILLALLTAPAMAQPKLVIANSDFDFGSVPQNSTAVNYYWFKSIGTDTARITQIKTGCDCVTMPLPRSTMPPGDSMLVGFFWETQHKIGQTGRYPYIFVEGMPDPVRMALKANVMDFPDSARPLSIMPFRVELSQIQGTSIDSVVLKFSNFGSGPVTLNMVSTVPKEFSYALPDTLRAGETRQGIVRILPGMKDKEFKSSMTIEWKSADGQSGRFTVPVRRKLFG
ncbi:MAG: DUF1573 domain-containing protein [Candidatus Zixiibacteriota bacterium]